MRGNYEEQARIFKVLGDPNRLKMIDILSCGEMCACHLLGHFGFTQPTLSHHMKVLTECGLVNCRKEGLWSYYSLNSDQAAKLLNALEDLTGNTEDCICKTVPASCGTSNPLNGTEESHE